MALLTIMDAGDIAHRGRPWSFRLENGDRYFFATGRALDEPVEVGEGDIRDALKMSWTKLTDWDDLRDLVEDRLNAGYYYVNAPYRRMSPDSLAKFTGRAVPPAPSPPTPSQSTTSSADEIRSLADLGEPWSLIRKLRILRDNTVLVGYMALDENGDELLKFDPDGGVDFAREHDLDIDWT